MPEPVEASTNLPRIYVSDVEAAQVLGRSFTWFKQHVDRLEGQFQFPKKDTAIRLRHLPSILEWAAERNGRATQPEQKQHRGVKGAF